LVAEKGLEALPCLELDMGFYWATLDGREVLTIEFYLINFELLFFGKINFCLAGDIEHLWSI
jgi:hypothetical protein